MRVSHAATGVSSVFDDPKLVSCAGLAPVVALADRCALPDLVATHLTLKTTGGSNAQAKVPALVAGMVAGADSIADMDLLRHGGMGLGRLFAGVRAPSTLGTFLWTFTFGHVGQFDAVAARFLAALARTAPLLLGAAQIAYLDIDDSVRATHGYQTGRRIRLLRGEGAERAAGHRGHPDRGAGDCRHPATQGIGELGPGAARLVAEALVTSRAAGASGLVILRADSAYYGHHVVAAARRGGARFSITARTTPAVTAAIAAIAEDAWTPISYPNAVWDETEQRLICDAEIADVPCTAFTSRRKNQHVAARLVVRRVKRLNPASVTGRGELFAAYRHHPVFTDSPLP